jgi:hypothetical protein
MPHVSPQKIDKEILEKIYKILFSSIVNRNVSQKQQRLAFIELLTHTEKIMLGKRLAAISMLSQNANPYQVGKILKLSTTTTVKLQQRLESGKFADVEKLCNILRKGHLQHYLENLFKPLPRYGTSPSRLFKEE